MIPELGHFALILALAVAAAQTHPFLCRRAALAQPALCLMALLALLWSFAVSDFTVVPVAEHSHTLHGLPRRMAGLWLDPGGAALTLTLVLTFASALSLRDEKKLRLAGLFGAALIALTLFALNPFERIATPPFDGLHPPAQEKPL